MPPDDFTRQRETPGGERVKNLSPLTLSPPVATYRFYCLMPDDFTRQRETPGGERVNSDLVATRPIHQSVED